MNRILGAIVSVALVLAVVAAVAGAGIGPSKGLPDVNTALKPTDGSSVGSDNMYYSSHDNVAGNRGSVMCVACHTRNPSTTTNAFTVPSGRVKANYMGSHFVTRNFADTSEGGGYSDGQSGSPGSNKTRAARAALPYYMAVATNVGTNWSYGSKYGAGSSTVINANDNNPNNVAAQMICESCHNIVLNGGANKLIADARGNTSDGLCRGCHGDMDGNINAEWQLHPMFTGTWGGTQHHRNATVSGSGGDFDNGYYGTAGVAGEGGIAVATHNMATMNRSWFNQAIGGNIFQMWGANYGELGATERALSYYDNVNKKMRTGFSFNTDYGQIKVSANGVLLCTNCHRAHNAESSSGATILMRSDKGMDNVIGNAPGMTGLAFTSDNSIGLWRMNDRGGRATAFKNTDPLCLGCHQ